MILRLSHIIQYLPAVKMMPWEGENLLHGMAILMTTGGDLFTESQTAFMIKKSLGMLTIRLFYWEAKCGADPQLIGVRPTLAGK